MIALQEIFTGGVWHEYISEGVTWNGNIQVLLDFNIQCDHGIETRRPGIIVKDARAKECKINDVAMPRVS